MLIVLDLIVNNNNNNNKNNNNNNNNENRVEGNRSKNQKDVYDLSQYASARRCR